MGRVSVVSADSGETFPKNCSAAPEWRGQGNKMYFRDVIHFHSLKTPAFRKRSFTLSRLTGGKRDPTLTAGEGMACC